jgi:hypothetical protein
MTQPDTSAQVLVLKRCRTEDFGHALGLLAGDVLVSVDGAPWHGSAGVLQDRMARASGPTVLGFQRAGVGFSVLCSRADLGQWARIPANDSHMRLPDYSEGMRNWQIMADIRGAFDLFPVTPSIIALIAPPVWLAQGRLWAALGVFAALVALALPVGLPLLGPIWVAVGVHLWRDGAGHQRVALEVQGFYRAAILASRSEAEAIATWQSLQPKARFRFAPAQAPVLQELHPGG